MARRTSITIRPRTAVLYQGHEQAGLLLHARNWRREKCWNRAVLALVRRKSWKHRRDELLYFAYCCEHGIGDVRKEEGEAYEWHSRAAELGSSDAMNNLGRLCENGIGVDKDEAEAFQWYGKVAERGNAKAMQAIAKCYVGRRGRSCRMVWQGSHLR